MTAAYDQETEKQWVEATPLDAIQDPPLRCRVKETPKSEWKESTLVGWDRSDEYQWGVSNPDIQWAVVCEVWKEPKSPTSFELSAEQERIANEWIDKRNREAHGPIGGRWSYRFCPTSIGVCVSLVDNASGDELDLTDYDTL
jgi:hypothetical protein